MLDGRSTRLTHAFPSHVLVHTGSPDRFALLPNSSCSDFSILSIFHSLPQSTSPMKTLVSPASCNVFSSGIKTAVCFVYLFLLIAFNIVCYIPGLYVSVCFLNIQCITRWINAFVRQIITQGQCDQCVVSYARHGICARFFPMCTEDRIDCSVIFN